MLEFAYQDEPVGGQAPPSLPPSATVRWRPLLSVTIFGPTGKRRFFARALLDPGADDTVFPAALMSVLDLTPRGLGAHNLRWRGQAYPLQFADVGLEISDGVETWTWNAVIGLSNAPIRYPILGQCGCLQYFDACFHGDKRLVKLETNQSFPGSTY